MKDPKTGSRPTDPYRREPPVIDLPKDEFTSSPQSGDDVAVAAADAESDTPTAIEPIASTGLDGATPDAGKHTDASQAASATTPTPDEEIPTDDPTPARSAGSVPPVSPTAPPAPEKRGVGGLVAASLAGGVIGAAFAVGADVYWRQPPADYESRLAALETRPRPVAPAPAAAQPVTEGLERRISALEAQARSLAEGVTAARSAAEASQKQVADLGSRPAAPDATAAPVEPDPAVRQAIERLGARLDTIEGRLAQAAPAAAIDELRTALQNGQNGAEERQRSTSAALGALQAATTGLNGRVERNGEEIAKVSADVAKLPPALLQAGLRSVVAGQIGQNLRSGIPLGAGISALERLGSAGPALDPLRPYAAQPAPNAQALAAEFKPLADRITAEPQVATGSITDRLLRVAEKVVTVRQVGDGSGRDVPGLVGRIEAALSRGALPEAAAAWDSLPEEPKRISAEWGARLKARVAADNAAQKLGADSLAALDAPNR